MEEGVREEAQVQLQLPPALRLQQSLPLRLRQHQHALTVLQQLATRRGHSFAMTVA